MNILQKSLLIFGIVGLIVCVCLYLFLTGTVEVEGVPVKIDSAATSTKMGFLSTDYYVQIQVEPTVVTEPKVTYILILDNEIMKNEYRVSWEQLEIDIDKIKTITNKISQDEYTALKMHPSYQVSIYEVKPQRQILYLLLGIAILVAGIAIASYIYIGRRREVSSLRRSNYNGIEEVAVSNLPQVPYIAREVGDIVFPTVEATSESIKKQNIVHEVGDIVFPIVEAMSENIKEQTQDEITGHITKALEAMDDTSRWYTDENEANRELVSCLKLQGLDAIYQFDLGDGITADAKAGNDVIIEGKLEPKLDEVNRLIGQLQLYSKYPYKIHIVIYGYLNEKFLRRINDEINSRYPNKVFLNYLPNPHRVRRQG